MDIEEIKRQYRDEWVLMEVTKSDDKGNPLEGKVVSHSRNRDDTYNSMKKIMIKNLAHFYTGEIPKKGYVVAFCG